MIPDIQNIISNRFTGVLTQREMKWEKLHHHMKFRTIPWKKRKEINKFTLMTTNIHIIQIFKLNNEESLLNQQIISQAFSNKLSLTD